MPNSQDREKQRRDFKEFGIREHKPRRCVGVGVGVGVGGYLGVGMWAGVGLCGWVEEWVGVS